MDEYKKEVDSNQKESDKLMIEQLAIIYSTIRELSKKISDKWVSIAPQENALQWLQSNKRDQKLRKDIQKINPEYLKADSFIKKRSHEEYTSGYYRSSYYSVQRFRELNFEIRIRKYLKSSYEEALKNPLSKYNNPALIVNDRNRSMYKIYQTIKDGIIQGKSLDKVNREIDIVLGYRNSDGKLLRSVDNYKGDFARRRMVLRTELNRMRGQAETDEYKTEQGQGIDTDLILVEVLDNRTRRQSAKMDGQKANKDGNFTYPDGRKAPRGQSGVAKWDINDRSTTITLLSDDNIESYVRSERVDKKDKVKPYETFMEYAKDIGLKRNKYGQLVE